MIGKDGGTDDRFVGTPPSEGFGAFMCAQSGGAIVNIPSLAPIAHAGIIAYEVFKAGVNNLTTSLAALHARDRIRCNAILPGLIDTPMAIRGGSITTGEEQAMLRVRRAARVPLGRMGTAWHVAHGRRGFVVVLARFTLQLRTGF